MLEVLAVVKPLADQKRLRVSIAKRVEAPLIEADPSRLRQILFNLLANAIKFTPDEGNISVEVEAADGGVTVSVVDDGPGLAPGEAARIFEPFERGRASRTVEGAGLGLTLARHLVELQGGRIWVASRRGRGSKFSFTIPLAAEAARGDAREEAKASA
jgi:signal transduction histidine kinase